MSDSSTDPSAVDDAPNSSPLYRWPSTPQLLAIADMAERLADRIGDSVLTTNPESLLRLPGGGIEDDSDVCNALQQLDWLFHGRRPQEALDGGFGEFWDETEGEEFEGDFLDAFKEWQLRVVARPGSVEDPDALKWMAIWKPESVEKELPVHATSLWPSSVEGSYLRLWHTVKLLKGYFRQTPIFALNTWIRTPEGCRRKEVEVPENECLPARKPLAIVGGECANRLDEGLPVELLEVLRRSATKLREAVKAEPRADNGKRPGDSGRSERKKRRRTKWATVAEFLETLSDEDFAQANWRLAEIVKNHFRNHPHKAEINATKIKQLKARSRRG